MNITEYSPTQLKQSSSVIFNEVQSGRMVFIDSKTRPCMVLMTHDNYQAELYALEKEIDKLNAEIETLKSK